MSDEQTTIDQKTGELLLTILQEINKPTPLPPNTCECGSPMPCQR